MLKAAVGDGWRLQQGRSEKGGREQDFETKQPKQESPPPRSSPEPPSHLSLPTPSPHHSEVLRSRTCDWQVKWMHWTDRK